MPTSLSELQDAWHTEARAIIRRRLLNKSRRKDRRWRDMVGNDPLRHLDVAIDSHLRDQRPSTANRLIQLDRSADNDRFTAIFERLLADQQESAAENTSSC